MTAGLLCFTTKWSEDYPAIFGDDYTWAKEWVTAHRSSFDQIATQNKLPSAELEAIVFPELIRYNGVFDALEIQSLKFLYISQGKDYADFSVGYFQMKPSFAEQVEKDVATYLSKPEISQLGFTGLAAQADNESSRSERIGRIISVDWQLRYLAAFYCICKTKFAATVFANDEERLRFYATCYNAGYHFSAEQVRTKIPRKLFHTGKFLKSANYCYADISAWWFLHRQ